MDKFYIKKVSASGPSVPTATVEFTNGVNIISGPSNTGKSYVIACINYAFGATDTPFDDDTGYSSVSVELVTNTNHTVTITRATGEGKTKATIFSTVPDIESKEVNISKNELSDVLLHLIGIKESHKIISTQKFKTRTLTWRTFWQFSFIDEDFIFKKPTILDTPKMSSITASLSALFFLINGQDYGEMVPTEDPDIREAKKKAVVSYINHKISALSERSTTLNENLSQMQDCDIEKKIQEIIDQIADTEAEILRASEQSKKMFEKIYEYSAKLEEATFLRGQYENLKSQYESNIRRLEFIVSGETSFAENQHLAICPFCDAPIHEQTKVSYIDASKKEMSGLQLKLKDLQKAQQEIENEIQTLNSNIEALKKQNADITAMLDTELKPHADELRKTLVNYKSAQQLLCEIGVLREISTTFSADAYAEEHQDDSSLTYDPKSHFTKEIVDVLNAYLEESLRLCAYPNFTSGYFSTDTCDVIVNGKRKSKEGKGYRAFLNTVFAFTLMKYLTLNAKYAPSLLILDSPILSLKEKGAAKATDSMKSSLFKYIIENRDIGQVIIAENEIPKIDYSNANVIVFTQDETEGRYGFLYGVK